MSSVAEKMRTCPECDIYEEGAEYDDGKLCYTQRQGQIVCSPMQFPPNDNECLAPHLKKCKTCDYKFDARVDKLYTKFESCGIRQELGNNP
jgi:hypothetical protein